MAKFRELALSYLRSPLNLIPGYFLLAWFAWKDFGPWLSVSWDALVVVTIIGGYLCHTFQLRRLSRSIPQDYWDSIKQNPDMLRYERHRVYGLLFLVLFSALIAWRIVKDFHL